MNCKAKGTKNEHRSMRLFESLGYECMRAAGSHGVFDFVAIGPLDVILCQVKTRDWPSLLEMETIENFITPANCRKLVHRWRDHQRLPDVREVN
jgi:Holliday junction resolvase